MTESNNNASFGRLDVFSCGTGLPKLAVLASAKAQHVFGSRKLLAALSLKPEVADVHPGPEMHAITKEPEDDAQKAILLALQGIRVTILASGDALYHGFGGTLARALQTLHPAALAGLDVCFHPGPTAFQELFHRLGLPWENARLFSCHAESPKLRAMLESQLAVCYAGSRITAQGLACEILRLFPECAARRCVLANALGTEEERIVQGSLTDAAMTPCGPTSILVLLPQGATSPDLSLGLPDACWRYERHRITNAAVRAVILAKLRLPAWGVLWDLGAGSGSVGIEALGLRPELHVYGVEREASRVALMRQNAQRLGVAGYAAIEGSMPECLAALPDPDRVFVGGGGKDLAAIVGHALRRLNPSGILVASAITLESIACLSTLSPLARMGSLSLDIAEETPLGPWRKLAPANRIHLFLFKSRKHS